MKPPSVFIIASNADYAPAWRVHQHLSDAGTDCFFCDEALLRVGEKSYQGKVEQALGKAAALVVVAGSRARVESEEVRGIWRRYLEKRGPVRPVTTVLCDGMAAEELPRTLRRCGSLTFPEELGTLRGRLLHSGESPVPVRTAPRPLCTRRFLMAVTALNVLILGAVVWLLQQRIENPPAGQVAAVTAGLVPERATENGTLSTAGLTTSGGGSADGPKPAAVLSAMRGSGSTGATADSTAPEAGEPPSSAPPEPREPARSLTETPAAGTPFYLPWHDEKLAFIFIPRGRFMMGSPPEEWGAQSHEPMHSVELTRGFWLAPSECTQSLWHAVMGTEPSYFTGHPELPVESVSWQQVAGGGESFLARMNRSRSLPKGWTFALPSEAQWEYACRAGTRSPWSFGKTLTSRQANIDGLLTPDKSDPGPWLKRTVRVASYPPNAWGLFDMHGNVAEYCADAYISQPLNHRDPLETKGTGRVIRGGSWWHHAGYCRSAWREGLSEDQTTDYTTGFRLAIVPAD